MESITKKAKNLRVSELILNSRFGLSSKFRILQRSQQPSAVFDTPRIRLLVYSPTQKSRQILHFHPNDTVVVAKKYQKGV